MHQQQHKALHKTTIMMKYSKAVIFIASTFTLLVSAEICTDPICEYNFVVRRWRSMTYSTPYAAYDVELNGTMLQIVENDYRRSENYPLIGTFVDASDVITADGLRRDIITINNQFPGPTIEVMQDSQIVINVTNEMALEGLTIHWHGLHMRETLWMDGTDSVTQCPIMPQQKFTYRFQADPPGTHWYHSHMHVQKQDGLYGQIIVHERLPSIPSYTLTVCDWFPNDVTTIAMQLPNGANQARGTGEMHIDRMYSDYTLDNNELTSIKFYSAMINGRGRHNNDPYPLAEFSVVQGLRYRFRSVHAGFEYPFVISIDDHKIDIVGSDGDDYSPITVDSYVMFPGESVDFEVLATHTSGLFWLRSDMFRKGEGLYPGASAVIKGTKAIIRYDGTTQIGDPTSLARNCTEQSPCTIFNCPFAHYYPATLWTTCIPLSDARSTKSDEYLDTHYGLQTDDADVTEIFLNLAMQVGPSINGRVFSEARVPAYHPEYEKYTIPCDDNLCDSSGCVCTHIKELPFNQTIQLVLSSLAPSSTFKAHHTAHLHGHDFAVLRMGFAEQNETTGFWSNQNREMLCTGENTFLCSQPNWNGSRPELNKVKPPIKNNIIIPSRGYAVVRFRSDNPGFWFLHCHQQLHQLEGMNMLLHEAPGYIKALPAGFPTCTDFEWSNEEYQDYLNSGNVVTDKKNSVKLNKASEAVEDIVTKEDSQDNTDITIPLSTAIGLIFAFIFLGAALALIPCIVYICCQRKYGLQFSQFK